MVVDFEEIKVTGNTKKYVVKDIAKDIPVGVIKWYPAYRKYAFFPTNATVYDSQFLKEIVVKLNQLMLNHKAKMQSKQIEKI